MRAISRDNWTTRVTQGGTNEIMREACARQYDLCVNNCDGRMSMSGHGIWKLN